MAASARLMILMSPEERAALDAKARALGVSAGEVVRRMSPQGRRDIGGAIDARSDGPAPEGDSGRVRLYGDAIRALRQVILLDERVRNSAIDLARLSQEVADLRDRVSRLEGMLAAGLALSRDAGPRRDRRRLPGVSDQTD